MIGKILYKISKSIQRIIGFGKYDRCYSQQECLGNAIFGNCGGLSGGASITECLSEQCIGCPYLFLERMESNEDDML